MEKFEKNNPIMALSCSKKLSTLLRGITSNHYGDFHCLNCLHSFRTKNKFESHKKGCGKKGFCKFNMHVRKIYY